MLLARNLKIASASIGSAKWRSLLTMLGVIIGVASVVTIVSIGEGVRAQVTNQIQELGEDLITIRPGQLLQRDTQGNVYGVSLFSAVVTTALSESDWKTIEETSGVRAASPFNVVSGTPSTNENSMSGGFIVGTTPDVPALLNTEIEFGEFFTQTDQDNNVAVIGRSVAEELFEEAAPMGKSVRIRGENFIVRGVFDEFPSSPLTITTNANYNAAVFIPYEASKEINDGQAQIYQVLARSGDGTSTDAMASLIRERLFSLHAGQENFTVLRQEENLAAANSVLTLLTGAITGIAAISLVVGGIGIMNIMLVSVSERTREIGIRKAVGATNQQILAQFLTEAVLLSMVGGMLGVLTALFANFLLRIFTDLQPVISLPVVAMAVGIALTVGAIFGSAPALKAARKDPIVSLRSGE